MLNEKQQATIISQLQAEPIVVKEIATDADGNDTIIKTTLTGEDQAEKTLMGLYSNDEIIAILTTTKEFIKSNKIKIARDGTYSKYFVADVDEAIRDLLEMMPLLNEVIPIDDYKEIFDNDNQVFRLELEWHKEIVKITTTDIGDVVTTTDKPVYSWLFRPVFANRNIVKITKKSSSSSSDDTPKTQKAFPKPDGYTSWVNCLKALGKEYWTQNTIDGAMKQGVGARILFRKILKDHPEYLSTLTINGHAITQDDLRND